ncbi:MAG TPA: hypothetical protein VNZ22_18290 [Bacillota bacterium]|nr:hypothetical protein [Bacillota bacterium]
MKRLFFSILALAAPFVLLLGKCEWRFHQVPWNEYAAKRALLEARADKVEVLVMGSSHAYRGILPSQLHPQAFNLAGLSQTLYYDQALVKKYLPKVPSLKMVILPVSYFSLECQLDEGIEKWRCFYYAYHYQLPHRNWHENWNSRNFSAFFLGSQQLGYKPMLRGALFDVRSRFDAQGGDAAPVAAPENEPAPCQAERLRQSALGALQRHHQMMRPENVQENRRLLEDFIWHLKQRGIEVVLVTLPTSRYYAQGMDPSHYQRMQATLQDLSAFCGVTYLNYTRDERFSDQDFADSDHLNTAGASKFTRILKEEAVAQCQPFF